MYWWLKVIFTKLIVNSKQICKYILMNTHSSSAHLGSSNINGSENLLQLGSQLCVFIQMRFLLIFMILPISIAFILLFLEHSLYFILEFIDLWLQFTACVFQLVNLDQHLSFTLFSLQRLSHAICYWTFIQCLKCLDSHFDFISNSNE